MYSALKFEHGSMDPTFAERAAAVLDGCRRAFRDRVSVGVDELLSLRNDLVPVIGSDGDRELLTELELLEHRDRELRKQQIDLRGLTNKKEYVTARDEAQHVGRRSKEGTRALGKRLKETGEVVLNLGKIEREVSEVIMLLAWTCRDLHHQGDFVALSQYVEAAASSMEQRNELVKKVRELSESATLLKSQLKSEKEVFDGKVLRFQTKTNEITEELLAVRNGTCKKTLAHRSEVAARKDVIFQECHQNENVTKEEISRLERAIKNVCKAHEGVVLRLTQKRSDLEKEVSERKEHFEDTLQKKEMKLAKLVDERETDLVALVNLERRWDKDEAKKKEIREEKERERQRKLDEIKQAQTEHVAAILIQKRTKSFLKRKAKAKASKGKKKGGKKGKKSKK